MLHIFFALSVERLIFFLLKADTSDDRSLHTMLARKIYKAALTARSSRTQPSLLQLLLFFIVF